MAYEVACLPCNDVPIDKCPCVDEGGACPHRLFHSDFASEAVREHRVSITIMNYLGSICRIAREQPRTTGDEEKG